MHFPETRLAILLMSTYSSSIASRSIVGDSSILQLCRRTISLIQIGANGEVQPLETG